MRVLLCCMPFGEADRPSLGLSLLKAGLTRCGTACDIRYFSIDFARYIGLSSYTTLVHSHWKVLMGEWVFSAAVFGAGPGNPGKYPQWVHGLQNIELTHGLEQACRFQLRQGDVCRVGLRFQQTVR